MHEAYALALQQAAKRYIRNWERDQQQYVTVVKELLTDKVCPKCILRLFKDSQWADYLLPVPGSPHQLQSFIDTLSTSSTPAKVAQPAQPPAPSQADNAPGPASDADGSVLGKRAAEAPPPDEPSSKQLQVEAAQQGCGDAANGQLGAKADQSAAGVSEEEHMSEQQQACPPCSLCLGILQLLGSSQASSSSGLPVETAGASQASQDAGRGSAAAPSGQQQQQQGIEAQALPGLDTAAICSALLNCGIEFETFGIEISLPAGVVLRERIILEHLSHMYRRGVFEGLRPDHIISLKPILRNTLSKSLSAALGPSKRFLEGQAADVMVCVSVDHQASRMEFRALVEDQVRFQQRKPQQQQQRSGGGPGGRQRNQGQADPPAAVSDEQVLGLSTDKAVNLIGSPPPHIFRKLYSWPPRAEAQQPATVSFNLNRAPLLLAGRYLKRRRGMPQSTWFDPKTGERIGLVSLAERITEAVLPVYRADEGKFISGGREDSDVRMMGEGRPFVLEIVNARRNHPTENELRGIEESLRASGHGAEAIGLRACTRAAVAKIKEAEESKEKTYEALCWAERALTPELVSKLLAVKHLEVMQDTPIRVLQRRAPKVRSKHVSIEGVDLLPSNPCYFKLRIRTQAGTYVKEFCHGEFGRTHPNLGTLLDCQTEILQLDVVAVHMPDWP